MKKFWLESQLMYEYQNLCLAASIVKVITYFWIENHSAIFLVVIIEGPPKVIIKSDCFAKLRSLGSEPYHRRGLDSYWLFEEEEAVWN